MKRPHSLKQKARYGLGNAGYIAAAEAVYSAYSAQEAEEEKKETQSAQPSTSTSDPTGATTVPTTSTPTGPTSATQISVTPQLAPVFQQLGDSPGAQATATNIQYAGGGQTASQPSGMPSSMPGYPSYSPAPYLPSPYQNALQPSFTDLANEAFKYQAQTTQKPFIDTNILIATVAGLTALYIFMNRPSAGENA